MNYCGQSPVHLAIETQNLAVISVILDYTDAEALHTIDNRGRYSIDYATRPGNHTKGAQVDCGGCKVLELLLQSDTALFPASLLLGLKPSRNCIQGHKILIKGLAERREKLKQLAYQTLSPAERQGLQVHPARILDQNATRVRHQLEARGCPIPMSLKGYAENTGSSRVQKLIYSHICSGEVAEYAHQLGFHYSDNELADFVSILATRMSSNSVHEYRYINNPFSFSYFFWMIDHCTSVSSRIPAGQLPSPHIEVTPAHYFMGSLGASANRNRGWTPDCSLTLAALEIAFSETNVDRCRCWCSPGGCIPLVKLLEGICWSKRPITFSSGRSLSQATEEVITGLFSAHMGKISEYQWIYVAIIRHYTSVMLGLRHACCSIIENASGPLPEEEYREIEEEDSFLLGLLESLLTEFECERRNDMRLEDFFAWMRSVWALRMREVGQELASQRLTDQQLQDAEAIGVVLRVHGPPPMGSGSNSRVVELTEGDLWDAMDELDKIATDPERPTKGSLETHT
jgi:hypothetical protein